MNKRIYTLIFVLFIFFFPGTAKAYTYGNISIHGFGSWAYSRTDNDNIYLSGDHDGNYDYFDFALNISAKPHDKLSIFVQPEFSETRGESEVELDYAFAEWAFSDILKLRMGKVKAPFMLCTETYDVGTIRPFFFLPQGLYHQLAAESYKGGGITGTIIKWDWEFIYDLYGGKLELLPKKYFSVNNLDYLSTTPVVNDMIGSRILAYTPVNGLGFGLSWYTGDIEFESQGIDPESALLDDTYFVLGLSAEYRLDPWWLRCEYLNQKKSPNVELDVGYAELAYMIGEHWQAAFRYEFTDLFFEPYDAAFEHKEFVFGLNYWFNANLVFKLSWHIVKGNLYALPETAEDYMEAIMNGFDKNTNLGVFGVQFSF